ncbi:2'-5' RNA ligase family protein [Nocardioides sp. GY 10127]|uniref:2'-5' RNA ligase family protein n=1 Tax=Nocardioides sp. GY 10127 TaxID=2569762 RepID=UPI0010A93D45|nr:2'-5' RNA ligase family protein [Nocardioides sp. GY 10127]TIC86574.1 2'-5' RNA ligase family protein [Nocardioides sp. GY 10127]
MRRPHSLELVLDDPDDLAVRRRWEALREAGLPSQADHASPTNAPHVSLVEAPVIDDAALDVARARLRTLLPVTARVSGLLVLGGRRLTLARPVVLDDDVVRRALAVRVQVPERLRAGWLPHLTLARGLDPARLADAVAVLAEVDAASGALEEVLVTGVRHWDPDRGHVRAL